MNCIKTDVFVTGIVVSLKQLLSDFDATIRHKSTEVLYIISGHASGRDAFLDYEIITPLSKLVCHWSVMHKLCMVKQGKEFKDSSC